MKVHSISLIVLATTTQSKIGIYFLVHKHNIFLLHNHLTMFLITSDESAKTLSGKTILFFHRDKGCSNCDKMRPIAKDFVADGITVYSIEADSNRDWVNKYAPKSAQWQFPLVVYLEDGVVKNIRTGIFDFAEVTKHLGNISDTELLAIKFDNDVELAQIRKRLFQKEMDQEAVMQELRNRQTTPLAPGTSETKRLDDFPLSPITATEAPIEHCE